MKINIASPGRFHVLDLARELHKQGHQVRFYSFVPTKRAQKFGLKRECNNSLLGVLLPFLALVKLFPKINFFKKLLTIVQDYATGTFMSKCDVFIAMSGNYIYSLKVAKKQGSVVIVERGSKHILEQKKILESIPSLKNTKPVPDFNVRRELSSYKIADFISIASLHVKKSFYTHGFSEDKLFVNPYGVELNDFGVIENSERKYDLIITGNWSYRKGCDLLIDACKGANIKLLHVGNVGDLKFPEIQGWVHIDKVDQKQLVQYYNKARVFVLPSREEGLALVQPQALACGLPVVCSMHTGGIDIANITGLHEWVFEMEKYTVEALKKQINLALNFEETSVNTISKSNLNNLLWESYGIRYCNFLNQIIPPYD